MAIINKNARKMEIHISGQAGNAFALLGQASKLAEQLGKDGEDITKRMMAGDYDHLLAVFDAEFGDYVDLVR